MGVQQSSKQGVQSDSQKRDNARYMEEAAPNSAPVAGAFGREGEPDDDYEDDDYEDGDDEDDEDEDDEVPDEDDEDED